ncbi:MAG: succinate dehydrogenase assembly factor 2 [Gammaproteobacteria bacterium]|jgi:antitoxin CptB
MGERERLAWRCRRGMLELDLMLRGFLERGYDQLDETGQAGFLRLLDYPDQTLLEILMGRMQTADPVLRHVVEAIRAHAAH